MEYNQSKGRNDDSQSDGQSFKLDVGVEIPKLDTLVHGFAARLEARAIGRFREQILVPLGQKLGAPAHKNDAYEEILYGVEGVLTWTVDGTPIEVGPGQALCIPRGAVHRFDNLGRDDVKQLAVITPAIMGPAYFREAAEEIGAAGGPPDRAKMMDVFRRHGMTVAALPPAK